MKYLDWNEEKNTFLKATRDVSFEQVQTAIEEGKVLDDFEHPNKKQYPSQRILVVNIENYAYYVPYTEDTEKVFLKTIFPSRKATKVYIFGGDKKK